MAIKTYKKGTATQLSTNFKSTEFDCHGSGCCSSTLVDENLVKYLQKIRSHFGKSVHINSGYRCKKHNAAVGGASASNHMDGEAADIRIDGVTPLEVAQYAEHIGVLGIGVYSWGVHIDTRTSKYFWYDGGASNVKTFGGSFIDEPEKSKIDTSKVVDKAADPKVIWDFFKSQGLNDYGIAGLMGNLYAESGLKPTNLQNTYEKKLGYTDAEYTAAVDQKIYTNFVNDSAGYGLAQWTYYSRKQNMLTFHTKKGKSIGDLNTQLEFLVYELTTSYKSSVWEVLKSAKSILEASNAVLLKFERPADQSTAVQNKRASFGQEYYNKYHVNETVVAPTVPSQGGTKMKYNASNKPLVCMQTQSTCYKGTSEMTVKGVLWHSTGANNPNLKRYVQPSDNAADKEEMLKLLGVNTYKNDWNHIDRQAGLNAWIGKLADGTVTTIQTMPWNYKPWGCGSGVKGSCNNGWIQFEICEDNLTDKEYFEKVYKEACELTAYLCNMYNIDPWGTVSYNGVKIPTILCHADAYDLKMGSNHGDVLHWFIKYNKDMDDVRYDVAALMNNISKPSQPEAPVQPTEMYRVRLSWDNAASQLGAYTILQNAIDCCNKVKNYYVFNSKGEKVYPQDKDTTNDINVGSKVKLKNGATYSSGKAIPSWLFEKTLYVRDIRSNNQVVISTLQTGAVTGVVDLDNLIIPGATTNNVGNNGCPYLVQVTADVLNVRSGAGTQYRVVGRVGKGETYTIVNQVQQWGKLKSGAGWICLDYTKKLVK